MSVSERNIPAASPEMTRRKTENRPEYGTALSGTQQTVWPLKTSGLSVEIRGKRVVFALLVGVIAGAFVYWYLTVVAPYVVAFDFTWAWRGGQALLAGQNPYDVIQPTGDFPYNSAFKYPLPVALVGVPVAHLDPRLAAAIFGAVGAALFAVALTRDGYWRLPILLSAPCLWTLALSQWSLYITAAALMPAVAWLVCLKPTTGLASFAYRPTRSAVIGSAVLYLACLLIIPTWPQQWVQSMLHDPSTHWYIPALKLTGGPLLLLAALKWRTPEGRMLLALAIVPQVQSFSAGLVALLVARTFREALLLTLVSCVGYLGWHEFDWLAGSWTEATLQDPAPHQAPWLMLSVYLPALVMVLRRPNEASRA